MLSERFLLLPPPPPPIDISAIIRHFYMCVIMDLQLYLLLCDDVTLNRNRRVYSIQSGNKKKKEETSVDYGIERKTLTGFYRTKHYQQREYIYDSYIIIITKNNKTRALGIRIYIQFLFTVIGPSSTTTAL